ncbi:MAG: Cof-type HAD-IIB family hydrolase [Agathobacter sp.]
MTDIKLVALDLDGTLFNSKGIITEKTRQEIKRIADRGVHVVISTGRPYNGVPFEQIKGLGIDYAITTNGAAIYQISTNKCIYENCMDFDIIGPIIEFLVSREIHIDTYIDGEGYTPVRCRENLFRLPLADSMKKYILATRTPVENLYEYVRDCGKKVQKMTLNFYPQPDGTRLYREEVRIFLESNPAIETVCGGFCNLEFSKAGVNKGEGLLHLAELLGVPADATMAIGDSGNDYSIVKAAAIGVAMDNASDDIKEISDFITTSNEEDGVGVALAHFIP